MVKKGALKFSMFPNKKQLTIFKRSAIAQYVFNELKISGIDAEDWFQDMEMPKVINCALKKLRTGMIREASRIWASEDQRVQAVVRKLQRGLGRRTGEEYSLEALQANENVVGSRNSTPHHTALQEFTNLVLSATPVVKTDWEFSDDYQKLAPLPTELMMKAMAYHLANKMPMTQQCTKVGQGTTQSFRDFNNDAVISTKIRKDRKRNRVIDEPATPVAESDDEDLSMALLNGKDLSDSDESGDEQSPPLTSRKNAPSGDAHSQSKRPRR